MSNIANVNGLMKASEYFTSDKASVAQYHLHPNDNGQRAEGKGRNIAAVEQNQLNQAQIETNRDDIIQAFKNEITDIKDANQGKINDAKNDAPKCITKKDIEDRHEIQKAQKAKRLDTLCTIGKWAGIAIATLATAGIFGLIYGLVRSSHKSSDSNEAQETVAEVDVQKPVNNDDVQKPQRLSKEFSEPPIKQSAYSFDQEHGNLLDDGHIFSPESLENELEGLKGQSDVNTLNQQFKVIANKIKALKVRFESKPEMIRSGLVRPHLNKNELRDTNLKENFRMFRTHCRTLLLYDNFHKNVVRLIYEKDNDLNKLTEFQTAFLASSFNKYEFSEKVIAQIVKNREDPECKNLLEKQKGKLTVDDLNALVLYGINKVLANGI